MVDIIEMKQRVAATEEKLKVASAQGERQSEQLLSLLQAVEKYLTRNQNEIRALRVEQAAAKDEIQQLRNLLQATLTLTETSSERRLGLLNSDLKSLFKRLDEIVANTNQDLDELFRDSETQALGVPKQQLKQKRKPRGKGLRMIFPNLSA